MDISIGSAVASKAGRDKGRFFAVVGIEGDFVYIADGNLRKLQKPKKKKLRHLARTTVIFSAYQLSSDKSLYFAIRERFGGDNRHKED
jgi:ribosomal protein L14E/L6E/L27E